MFAKIVQTLLGAAIEGAWRFPVTALAVVITAIVANLDIADWIDIPWQLNRQIYSTLAAFAIASLVKQIAVESRGYGKLMQHVSAVLAGVVTAAIVWFAEDVRLSQLAMFAGLIGALFVSAHWFRGTSAGFWFFVVRLLFSAGLALIAVLTFALGVSAIFTSLDYLFGVDVPGDLYYHVWATSLIAAGPLFALGRIPADFDVEPLIDGNNIGIAGLRLLSDFLAAPLLLIYALILHAYAIKVVISGDVPENQIGWMVIGFGTLVIFFWKLMLPLRSVLTISGRTFLRYWSYLVVVPMALLLYAIYLRVDAYGVTPDRYFLAAFGLLMMVFALMQAVPSLRDWLPGAAPLTVLVLLLGGFGPWGAEWLSINSQVAQFGQILDGKSQVLQGQGNRAANIMRFLNRRKALPLLSEVVTGLNSDPFAKVEKDSTSKLYSRLEKAVGVDAARRDEDRSKGRQNVNFSRDMVQFTGYDLLKSELYFYSSNRDLPAIELRPGLEVKTTKDAIVVINGQTETVFPFSEFYKLTESLPDNSDAMVFELNSGDRRILIIPQFLYFSTKPEYRLTSGRWILLLRSKDWQ